MILSKLPARNARMFGALAAILMLGAAQTASAEPEFLDTITAKYHISDSSKLGEKSCGICHISDSDYNFNAYGKQLKKYLADNNLKTVSTDVLTAVDSMDANGNGVSNGDEIKADKEPGLETKPAATTAPKTVPTEKPLVPKNAFHPAIVHFPIALLIAGLMLDLVGLLWKKQTLLVAGWYNLVLGAVSALGGLASGFAAMMFMKLPYKGLIFDHLRLAIGVTVVMWLMVALRVHRHDQMKIVPRILYYALAVAAFLMVSVTGHLGGEFVYGG